MESSPLVSWQFENFSSAELNVSPPVSPSPPRSPSLYNGATTNNLPQKDAAGKTGCVAPGSAASIRAQLATSFLNDLEHGSLKMDMNDFGMNWNEESVNLNLFEELAEIEYTPPSSPIKRSNVVEPSLPIIPSSTSLSNIQLPQPIHILNGQASESSADITTLTAEFQAILDSLPKDSDNTDALSHVLEIAGIPMTIIDGEALVPVELDLTSITHTDMENIMEIDDVYANDMDGNDSDVIEESELYDISNQGSPAYSVHSSSNYGMTTTVVDEHSEAAQKILDALLAGDVDTAETYLPDIDVSDDESTMSSEDSFQLLESQPEPRPGPSKPERRGRKPTKKLTKKSSGYIKDKTVRKKEQNKTAATRYRQKKKIEFSIVLESEAELQREHDSLEKKKDDLQREIDMVKQLLRDVIKSKKPTVSNISIVHVGGPLPSTGRNRRK